MKFFPTPLSTAAAFTAGLTAVMLWPAAPGGAELKRRQVTTASPLPGQSGAAGPVGKTRLARLAESQARLAGMSPAEARDALQRLTPHPGGAEGEWWGALLGRWAEGEPAEALAWLKKMNHQSPVEYAFAAPALAAVARQDLRLALFAGRDWPIYDQRELFRAAALADPRAAVEFAASRPQLAGRGFTAAFSEWLRADAGAAVNWLRTEGKSNVARVSRDMMEDMATLAPGQWDALLATLPEREKNALREQRAECGGRAGPLAMMAKLPELKEEERRGAIQGTVTGLLRLGDAANLGRLLASLSGEERESATSGLGGGIYSIPPEQLKALLGLKELTFAERLHLLSESAGNQGPEEFLSNVEGLRESSGNDPSELQGIIKSKWLGWLGGGGPEDFESFGRLLRAGKTAPGLPLELMGDFGRERNPVAAKRLLESLPEDQRAVPQALHTVFAFLRDPSTDLAPLLRPELSAEARREVFENLFQYDLNAGPDQSSRQLALLERLPGNLKAEAFTGLLKNSQPDLEAYAPLVREMTAAAGAEWSPELTETVTFMARQAARQDPAAGFAWAETAPPGPLRKKLGETLFGAVLPDNAVAASEWLARQPEGPDRDDMARQMVNQIQSSDPASAWQWAASIQGDPVLRRALQEKILPLWHIADPEAASRAAASQIP